MVAVSNVPTTPTAPLGLSWELLRDLEARYGDSFYILDIQGFQQNYDEFLSAFQRYYAQTQIAYSYKTNYIPQLCKVVNERGGYAEVVSAMEYELALRVGVDPRRIIFNGPYKSESDLERALLAGSIVNLDAWYEVELVERIARRAPDHTLTIGLRCNFDLEDGRTSRLGFDVMSEEFFGVLATLKGLDNVRLGGLHLHYSTGHRSIESYALRTRKILDLTRQVFGPERPQFVNLGGGYFSKMSETLRQQFNIEPPTYADYAAAIASQVAEAFPGKTRPELILEPGSAITANILYFMAKIIHIKQVRSRTIGLASGSIHNIKPTLHSKNMPMQIFHAPTTPIMDSPSHSVDIVGYTCMEHDCLHEGYQGAIAAGDYALFDNLGAYTIVMKPPFIRPCPPIIAYYAEQNSFKLIKRREETDDVFATFVV